MKKENLKSVIQPEFLDLLQTGEYAIHHVFPGTGRRRKCEQYGFLVALRPAVHDEVHHNPNTGIDKILKDACYEYWIKNYGTEDEFKKEFG